MSSQLIAQANSGDSVAEQDALFNLNRYLFDTYNSLVDLQGVQTNALSKQNDVLDIVSAESERLNSKKAVIDQASLNQKRIIFFNDNSRKIYAAYIKIIVTLAITLAIVYILRVLYFNSLIPESVLTLSIIITLSVGLIIMYNYYAAIRSRDPYNFDELKLDPPSTPNPNATVAVNDANLLFGGMAGCIGSQCCTPATNETAGTMWNSVKGKCEYANALAPTTTTVPTVPISTPTFPISTPAVPIDTSVPISTPAVPIDTPVPISTSAMPFEGPIITLVPQAPPVIQGFTSKTIAKDKYEFDNYSLYSRV